MEELKKPIWRNLDSYINTLNKQIVIDTVMDDMESKHNSSHALKNGYPTAKDEIKSCLPKLMNDIRIYDVAAPNYYCYSLVGVVVFLICEVILLYFVDFGIYYRKLILLGFISFIVISLYLSYLAYLYYSQNVPKFLLKISDTTFRAFPVGIIGVLLLFINFYLVIESGWSSSPFMPALVFLALTIISGPRENSLVIVLLTILSILLVLLPYLLPYYWPSIKSTDQSNNANINNVKLGIAFNVMTFIFSAIMMVILRSINSKRIKNDK